MGDPVAMVHCNNGCGELDKWVELFGGDYAALLTEAVAKGMEILRAEGVYPASLRTGARCRTLT